MVPRMQTRWRALSAMPTNCRCLHRGIHIQSRARWINTASESAEALAPARNVWTRQSNLAPRPNTTPRGLVRPAQQELKWPNFDAHNRNMQGRLSARAQRMEVAQMRFEKILELQGQSMPHWTETLEKLKKRTPKRRHGWRRDAVKILLPAECAQTLLSNYDYNIWEIHDRAKAEVHLYKNAGVEDSLESAPGKDLRRAAVILSGDDVALRAATEMVMRVSDEAEVVLPDPSNPTRSLIPVDPRMASLHVITSRPKEMPKTLEKAKVCRSNYQWHHRFEDLPKPVVWTQESFFEYIRILTTAKLQPHVAMRYYGTPQAADEVRMVLIEEAFRDQSTVPHQTVAAFTRAIEGMEEYGLSFRAHARRLFTLMTIRKLPIDTTLFNKFLLGAARVRDLHNFNQLLNLMERYECAPDYATWRLFLNMLDAEKAKTEAVRAMHSLGLLHNPHAGPDIARELVPFDTYRAVQEGKTVADICQQAEERYGVRWHSTTALTRMVSVFSYFARYDMSFELLDYFEQKYERSPSQKTFVAMMQSATLSRYFVDALKILRRWERAYFVQDNHHLYAELFRLAWFWRLPNVMAVVWAYACLNEWDSYPMRLRVSRHMAHPGFVLADRYSNRRRRVLSHFEMPGYVPLEMQESLKREIEGDEKAQGNQGSVLARLFREHYYLYTPEQRLSVAVAEAFLLDKELIAARRRVTTPGSHVGSILPAGEGPKSTRLVLRHKYKALPDVFIHIPTTTTFVAHNYEPAWYTNFRMHPQVDFNPGDCQITWRDQGQQQRALALGRARQRSAPAPEQADNAAPDGYVSAEEALETIKDKVARRLGVNDDGDHEEGFIELDAPSRVSTTLTTPTTPTTFTPSTTLEDIKEKRRVQLEEAVKAEDRVVGRSWDIGNPRDTSPSFSSAKGSKFNARTTKTSNVRQADEPESARGAWGRLAAEVEKKRGPI